MPITTLQTHQMANEAALPSLGKAARTTLDQTIAGIEKNLDLPLRASAAQAPDASLYFTANKITRADGTALTTPPISSTIPSVTAGSINFQTQATSGGSFDITFPASTVGYFRRVGFTLFADGVVRAIFSPEVATIGALANPGTVFAKGLPICYVDLECTNVAGQFKTAGSATNIIENSVGGTARIVMFGAGGGGAGSGDANSFLEDIKNRLRDSFFEFVTPNVFAQVDQDLISNTSTGTYDVADAEYDIATGESLISEQMYGSRFLSENSESIQAEIMVLFGSIPTTPTVEISKNGGANYEAVTMSQVGSSKVFRGVKVLATPAGVTSGYPVANADNNTAAELNATTRQSYAMKLPAIPNGQKTRVVSGNVYVNKIGTPVGDLTVKIVKDSSGAPGTEVAGQNKTVINIASLSSGVNTVNFQIPAILIEGIYWVVVETSASYKSSFSAGVTSLVMRTDASGGSYSEGDSRQYNGTWSAHTGFQAVFELLKFNYDLRVKTTAAAGSGSVAGYGILYGENTPQNYQQEPMIQRFDIDGDDDVTEFTVTKFVPSAMKLRVYDTKTGQVYRFPAFALDGRKVIFAAGQFLNPGETITLLFDQAEQGEFDNSDVNGNLLASNGLGSTDLDIDRSSAGVGVKLRSPDGQLWHVTVTNAGAILTTAL